MTCFVSDPFRIISVQGLKVSYLECSGLRFLGTRFLGTRYDALFKASHDSDPGDGRLMKLGFDFIGMSISLWLILVALHA